MPLRAVQRRARVAGMHGLDVHGVERMQVDDGGQAVHAVGNIIHPGSHIGRQRVGIQKHEAPVLQAHQ